MLSPSRAWAPLALLIMGLGAKGSLGHAHNQLDTTTVHDPICTANVTVFDTTTVVSATTIYSTVMVDVLVNSTTTNTVSTAVTEYTTTTVHCTVNVTETETDSTTVTTTGTASTTVTTTGTASTTVTTTGTASTTVTTTGTVPTTVTTTGTVPTTVTTTGTVPTTVTTTDTVPATITTYTTQTIFSTTYEPCPKICSISAETVNLRYWPTNRPYTYPSTWVDTNLSYTFTSPSVYMLIPTAKGTNSLGQPYGPQTTNWILPLDLYDVSTIAEGSITRQLTLADLGTDCPQTADPTAIATMVDARCDPILAAPRQVSSWAYPCNACGRFGLFDPPYAVPTVTGPLVTSTPVVTVTAPPVTTTAPPTPVSSPPVGILEIIYYSDGKPVATAIVTQVGITGTITSSVNVSPAATATATTTASSSTSESLSAPDSATTKSPSTSALTSTSRVTSPVTSQMTSPATVSSTSATTSPSPSVVTASAARVSGGISWLISGVVIAVFLL